MGLLLVIKQEGGGREKKSLTVSLMLIQNALKRLEIHQGCGCSRYQDSVWTRIQHTHRYWLWVPQLELLGVSAFKNLALSTYVSHKIMLCWKLVSVAERVPRMACLFSFLLAKSFTGQVQLNLCCHPTLVIKKRDKNKKWKQKKPQTQKLLQSLKLDSAVGHPGQPLRITWSRLRISSMLLMLHGSLFICCVVKGRSRPIWDCLLCLLKVQNGG